MYKEFNISDKLVNLSLEVEDEIKEIFEDIDKNVLNWSSRVLKAFQDEKVNISDFNEIKGYGYSDPGREKLERVYARVFRSEDALVRPQIMSGTHALTITFFGLLKHGDTLISISGTPYDTIRTVIGTEGTSESSLINNGIKYEEIDLIDNDFDYDAIKKRLSKKDVKMVEIQRSVGYSDRMSLHISKIKKVIEEIRSVNDEVIIFVDNCYGCMVEEIDSIEVGADVVASSLMKNLGSGIASSGGYIVGREKYIKLISERLNVPGGYKDMGADFGVLETYYKGLFNAPEVVGNALKTQIFASCLLEKLGFNVYPKYNEKRTDIIQIVEFGDEKKLIDFCKGLQMGGAIDSFVTPVPCDMPGYPHKEIMAGSSFIPGSTIELSADGPLIPPYKAFMQGGITYEYGKLGILIAINNMVD